MDKSMFELRKLYDMLGTVASAQYQEQIQTVCVAFFESGQTTKPTIPEFKTEKEYEDYIKLVLGGYKNRLYRDGLKAGAEIQQNAVEVAFGGREYYNGFKRLDHNDINAVLAYLREKVPHE